MTEISFNREAPSNVAFEARVPAGIERKSELLQALAEILRLPNYFGRNWDALEECMRDLAWLPEGIVALIHEDVPLENDRQALATYLSILSGALRKWTGARNRRLVVLFPPGAEEKVKGALLAVRDE